MRPKGSAVELENRRRLAVACVKEGYRQADVARVLKADSSSVRRWIRAEKKHGDEGLAAVPHSRGRSKLTPDQESVVLRWLQGDPVESGLSPSSWTASHVMKVIEQTFGVTFHPKYIYFWLKQRGIQPPGRHASA